MEVLSKLGIEWKYLLAQGINFLILLWILKRYAYKPMLEFLSTRTERIEQGIKDAESAKQRLLEIEEEEKMILSQARAESKKMIAEAELQAKERAKKREQVSEEKIAKLIEEGEQRIEDERARMLIGAKNEIAVLVTETLEKVLAEKIDGPKDQELIARLTKKINE